MPEQAVILWVGERQERVIDMLTPADEYPLHQTAEPMAFAGTDRNFYDRFFFNGISRDGSLFFAVALGVYPQLGIMDAALSVLHAGKQYVLRSSKHMDGDRLDTSVGPITVEIVEPLHQLRIKVAPNDGPLMGDMRFEARHAPIEEPRFTRRIGTRAFMDYTRMTQCGAWHGELRVDGQTIELRPEQHWGTRDRSWGIRPVGAAEPQPPTDQHIPQFFWLWAPANFENYAVFCHTNDDESGRPWNRRAVVQPLDGEAREFDAIRFGFQWKPGSRRLVGCHCALEGEGGEAILRLTAGRHFYMAGLGYTHAEWGHGMDRGRLTICNEIIDIEAADDADPALIHVQALAAAELEIDGKTHEGVGVIEQLFIGPHQASGLTGLLDPVA